MVRLDWSSSDKSVTSGVSNAYLQVDKSIYAWPGLTSVGMSPRIEIGDPIYIDGLVVDYKKTYAPRKLIVKAFTYPDVIESLTGFGLYGYKLSIDGFDSKRFNFSWKTTTIGANGEETYTYNFVYDSYISVSDYTIETMGSSVTPTDFSFDINVPDFIKTGDRPRSIVQVKSKYFEKEFIEVFENYLYGTKSTEPKFPTFTELVDVVSGSNLKTIGREPWDGLYLIDPGINLSGTTFDGLFTVVDETGLNTRFEGTYEKEG